MTYMKQLDSVRALAVLCVLYTHFYQQQSGSLIEYGSLGVDLFFVLSGFLITGILLKSKSEINIGRMTILESIINFFGRRVLRIFPIYYLTLVITFVLAIKPARETVWWNVCYLSNFYFAKRGEFDGTISHFWSLAVEEQFYLLWPWIIFLTPRKHLLKVFVMIITVSPVYRHICNLCHTRFLVDHVILLANLDLFGLGASLAWLRSCNMINSRRKEICLNASAGIGGLVFIMCILKVPLFTMTTSTFILERTFEGLLFIGIIHHAADGFKGTIGAILELKPLPFLGKISYGIYLYHLFAPSFIMPVLRRLNIEMSLTPAGQFFLYTTATIVVAAASWQFIEKPMARLKEKLIPFPLEKVYNQ